MIETLAHGTHLRELRKSFTMNTNMTGFSWFSKRSFVWTKVASALEGSSGIGHHWALQLWAQIDRHMYRSTGSGKASDWTTALAVYYLLLVRCIFLHSGHFCFFCAALWKQKTIIVTDSIS